MAALVALVASALACNGSGNGGDAGMDAFDAPHVVDSGSPDITPIGDAMPDGWTIAPGCNPLATTSECMLPYPSDFLTVPDTTAPTGLRMAIPQGAIHVPSGRNALDMTPFNRVDGAPTSAPILVHFGVDVASSFLVDDQHTQDSLAANSPIALMDATTGDRIPFLSEMDANAPSQTGRHVLIIRPLTPLAFGTRYIVAIRNTVTAVDGSPIPQSPGFAALRDGTPTTVAPIEMARARFETLFTFLANHGYPRNQLLLAWDYTTASRQAVIGPITGMRQQVFTAAAANQIGYTITSVVPSTVAPGAVIVEGTFTPPNYLQADNTIQFGADGVPVLQTSVPAPSYPFTMIVPSAGATQSVPLVVFGHGLFGTGRDYLTGSIGNSIQPLAQTIGAVVVATDWIGLSGGDETLIINNVAPNLNRIGIVTDRLLQALVNNLSLIELCLGPLQADPMVRMSMAHPLLDATKVYYYGVSLGGIEGSSLVSVSRHISRAIVAVPGASWSNLLARSVDYAMIQTVINLMYPDALLQQEFITLLQTRFDPADPVNLATLFQRNPLPDAPAHRIAVLQESIGDCQVPNLTTEILARAYGVPEVTPFVQSIFGLTTVTAPTTMAALSQFQITTDTAMYLPPSNNVLPSQDNGAHSDLPFRPAALDQMSTLLTTGQIVQNCGDAGACVIP